MLLDLYILLFGVTWWVIYGLRICLFCDFCLCLMLLGCCLIWVSGCAISFHLVMLFGFMCCTLDMFCCLVLLGVCLACYLLVLGVWCVCFNFRLDVVCYVVCLIVGLLACGLILFYCAFLIASFACWFDVSFCFCGVCIFIICLVLGVIVVMVLPAQLNLLFVVIDCVGCC